MSIGAEEVKKYYNDFLSRLKRDHVTENKRHFYFREHFASRYIKPGNTVLDLGCGTGITSLMMANMGGA